MEAIGAFSTLDAPAARRAGLFKRQMADWFSVGLAVTPSSDQPLRTDVKAYCGRRLQVAALRFSPHTTSGARIGRRGQPRLLVTVNKEGPTYVCQDGRESWIGADDIFVIDPSRPFHIESGHILTHSVYFPAATLRALAPSVDDLTALAIDGRGGCGAVFRATLDEVLNQVSSLGEDEADRVADMLPHVFSAALNGLKPELQGSSLRLAHKQRIKRFARENLGDPELDSDGVARAVDLSVRYVHQLFADEKRSLMKWIWDERLERCRQAIAAPEMRARPIGEIAYMWGFNSLAHFSRAFRARYGVSPRQMRAGGERGATQA